MAHDVFISYSTKDQKIVEAMSHYLEENGVRCFVAYRDISIGEVWAGAITKGIESCKIMVVIFSDNFNQSIQVDREIEMAAEEKKPILTFRVTNSEFLGVKKYYLKNINWIDAFPNYSNMFSELLQSIRALSDINNMHVIEEHQNQVDSITDTPIKAPNKRQINILHNIYSFFMINPNLINFNGRSTRREYIKFIVLILAFMQFVAVADILLFDPYIPVFIISYILFILPLSVAITIRRLHDIGVGGKNVCWIFILMLSPIVLLVIKFITGDVRSGQIALFTILSIVGCVSIITLMFLRGNKNSNKYGDNPRNINK